VTSKLLINEYPLQVLPTLAVKIGLNEALFLQQLHYWLGKSGKPRDDHEWIYKTYKEWVADDFPFWNERTIKRIVESLQARKLIMTTDKYNKSKSDRTLWYAIDYEKVAELEQSDKVSPQYQSDRVSLPDDKVSSSKTVTERHAHTREKTTDKDSPASPEHAPASVEKPVTPPKKTKAKPKQTDPAMPKEEFNVWQQALLKGKTGIDYSQEKDKRPPEFWRSQFSATHNKWAKWWAGYLPSWEHQPPEGVTPEKLIAFYTWCREEMNLSPSALPQKFETIERQWGNWAAAEYDRQDTTPKNDGIRRLYDPVKLAEYAARKQAEYEGTS